MRIIFASAVLLCTAACVAPQQQGAYCPWARQTLAAMAATQGAPKPPPVATVPAPPVAAVPAPPPPPPPPPPPAASTAWPFQTFSLFAAPARPGRLTLSNFTFPLADLQAIVTPYPDCAAHPGIVPEDFKLPRNGTWIIPTPAGSDVCWRRLAPGAPAQGVAQGVALSVPVAAEWNHAYTAGGGFITARL
ncbi:MAG TPA: hypothetical protein VME41_10270 [Stellaceae bacterium]|nr:hypothetical protein [Stellaceae bacterium]